MDNEQQTVADALARALRQAGIQRVFGLPGGENTALLEALQGESIDFHLVRNESSALFMADATARLTARPGVSLTTLGPGATNAYVGVAHAFLDRSPVLALTAQSPQHFLGRHTHQVLDLQAIFAPVTKRSATVTAANAGHIVGDALQLAMQARPGPVHLGIASDVATQRLDVGGHGVGRDAVPPQPIDLETIGQARRLLAGARRPLIVVGLGLEPQAPYAALCELADAADAPLLVTPKAKGAIAADHPLYAATIGLTQSDPGYAILEEADCIVAIGFDVVELVRLWEVDAPLIWLAPWPNQDPQIPAAVELTGEMAPVLELLTDSDFATSADWGAARVAAFRAHSAQKREAAPAAGTLWPQDLLASIRAAAPRDLPVSTDVGSHKILTALEWPALAPNRYMVSNGLSAMGFGLCAAIAAALELRSPALCITGDAGFSMVMGELGLVVELQLPVICVIMNDGALDLIRANQIRNARAVYGTEFANPDFELIARAYGVDYYRVTTSAECSAATSAALRLARPALIEAMIDPSSYPTTPK